MLAAATAALERTGCLGQGWRRGWASCAGRLCVPAGDTSAGLLLPAPALPWPRHPPQPALSRPLWPRPTGGVQGRDHQAEPAGTAWAARALGLAVRGSGWWRKLCRHCRMCCGMGLRGGLLAERHTRAPAVWASPAVQCGTPAPSTAALPLNPQGSGPAQGQRKGRQDQQLGPDPAPRGIGRRPAPGPGGGGARHEPGAARSLRPPACGAAARAGGAAGVARGAAPRCRRCRRRRRRRSRAWRRLAHRRGP